MGGTMEGHRRYTGGATEGLPCSGVKVLGLLYLQFIAGMTGIRNSQ